MFCCIGDNMTTPNWLKSYVESLTISVGGRMRSDCPVCGKSNTFSVSDTGLQRLWFCFHADCHTKGCTDLTLTKEKAKTAFTKRVADKIVADKTSFQIPDTFVSLSRNLDAESYVKRVGAYDAYLAGRVDIRYDFRQHRVAYMIKQNGSVIDAAGRALRNIKPKWYRYNDRKYPFICGSSPVGIVVEDAASACAVSNIATGIALLGTNLPPEYIDVLTKFEKIYVALDKDATSLALTMVRQLATSVPTKMIILKRDLKDMTKDERDDFITSKLD